MPDTAKRERGIIRRLKRRIARLEARGLHPKRLYKSLARHRREARHARPPLRLRAYHEAKKLIGVMEVGGNNAGARVAEIIRASGGDPAQRPAWCGYTVGTIYKRAGSKLVDWRWGAVRLLGFIVGVRKTRSPRCGDIVRFTFSHTGLFVRHIDSHTIETIEGNTGATGAVSDGNGRDGVYRKRRDTSLVLDYLRVTR